MSIDIAALTVGQDIGSRSITVTRTDLVKYAGASGRRFGLPTSGT